MEAPRVGLLHAAVMHVAVVRWWLCCVLLGMHALANTEILNFGPMLCPRDTMMKKASLSAHWYVSFCSYQQAYYACIYEASTSCAFPVVNQATVACAVPELL